MERIVCEWCKEENEPDRTDCKKCGAALHIRDRISDPASNQLNAAFRFLNALNVNASEVLATGQRVWGILWEFSLYRDTPRMRGKTASVPQEFQ